MSIIGSSSLADEESSICGLEGKTSSGDAEAEYGDIFTESGVTSSESHDAGCFEKSSEQLAALLPAFSPSVDVTLLESFSDEPLDDGAVLTVALASDEPSTADLTP